MIFELEGQRYPLKNRVAFMRSLEIREAVTCTVSPEVAKKVVSSNTESSAKGMSKRTTNSRVSATSASPS